MKIHLHTIVFSLFVLLTLCQCEIHIETHFKVCSKAKLINSANALKEISTSSQLECARACRNDKDCQSANVVRLTDRFVCQLRNDAANNCNSLIVDPDSNMLIQVKLPKQVEYNKTEDIPPINIPQTTPSHASDCASILAANPNACPTQHGYTCNDTSDGPICLQFLLQSKQTHLEATITCSEVTGGHLVFIENDDILRIVRDRVLSVSLSNPIWTDGFDYYGNTTLLSWNGLKIAYPQWAKGFPKSTMDCVKLGENTNFTLLKTQDCTKKLFTVCQKEL